MTIRDRLTNAIEDYIKIIYEVAGEEGRASTNAIAARMKVTPASVTGMAQRLAGFDPPLVEYRKHRGVRLTPVGEKVALEVIRYHRLLELYLCERLGFSWDEVHAEADRLEHVISEELEARIDKTLGHPTRDPHGDPIPTEALELLASDLRPLSKAAPGSLVRVVPVANQDVEVLRYLRELRIIPGTKVQVVDQTPFDENLHVVVPGQDEPVVLGPRLTQQIWVEMVEKDQAL